MLYKEKSAIIIIIVKLKDELDSEDVFNAEKIVLI